MTSISSAELKRRLADGEMAFDAKTGKFIELNPKTGKPKAAPKYRNRITEVDDIKFHSALEAKYYNELKLKQQAGLIQGFERQVRYPVVDELVDENGVVYSKAIDYVADFNITHLSGEVEVVDVKGMILDLYTLKKALMFQRYGIKITEIGSKQSAKKTPRKQYARKAQR